MIQHPAFWSLAMNEIIASSVKAGMTVVVEQNKRLYRVKVTSVTSGNGIVSIWYKAIDVRARGEECSLYEANDMVRL